MNNANKPLRQPLRVLVAEDEFLVGLMIEEYLRELGHEVAGPFSDLDALRTAISAETFDVAVLDVNLNGQMVFPVADQLLAEKRPFVLSSGYGRSSIPERFRSGPILAKPYDYTALDRELRRIAGAAAPSSQTSMGGGA